MLDIQLAEVQALQQLVLELRAMVQAQPPLAMGPPPMELAERRLDELVELDARLALEELVRLQRLELELELDEPRRLELRRHRLAHRGEPPNGKRNH